MELSQRGRIASAEPGGAGRGREGKGLEGAGRVCWSPHVNRRQKSRLLSPGREAPCWHSASAEKLESSIARSAAVLEQDNEKGWGGGKQEP